MKRTQCQAVAKTTGNQCENNALIGGTYCLFHTPKREPFIFLLLGALIGFGFQTIYDMVLVSPEENRIISLQNQIKSYQKSIENKDQKIADLENITNSILEYSDVAHLDALGNPPGYGPGSDIVFNSELTKLLEGTYSIRNGRIHMDRSDESEVKYRQAIKQFPKFPFGYFFVALCLKEKSNEEWKVYARKAVEILKQTTKIDGHNKNHDEILAKLNIWLVDNRGN